MSKLLKFLSAGIIIFASAFSVFAVLVGKGEVKGEVMSSWVSGDQVRFRLSITNQASWSGPRLSNPNNFVYGGEGRMRITEGDQLDIIYNSSDGDYINVEKIEFINDRPGEIDQSSYFLPVIIAIGILVVIFIVIYFIRRKQVELHTT